MRSAGFVVFQCCAWGKCHVSHHHPKNEDSTGTKKLEEDHIATEAMHSYSVYLILSPTIIAVWLNPTPSTPHERATDTSKKLGYL